VLGSALAYAVHLLLPRRRPPHRWGSAPGTPAPPGAPATACAAPPPAAVSLLIRPGPLLVCESTISSQQRLREPMLENAECLKAPADMI